jgi:hypothetical protein
MRNESEHDLVRMGSVLDSLRCNDSRQWIICEILQSVLPLLNVKGQRAWNSVERRLIELSSEEQGITRKYIPPPIPIPIMTLQKISSPVIVTTLLGAAKACARVDNMMIANSTPYIFRLPTRSARKPNPSCPATAPPEVAALIAVFTFPGNIPKLPPEFEPGMGGPCQNT